MSFPLTGLISIDDDFWNDPALLESCTSLSYDARTAIRHSQSLPLPSLSSPLSLLMSPVRMTQSVIDAQCSICLDSMRERCELNCCTHTFCYHCISLWCQTSNSCPLCKRNFASIRKSTGQWEPVEARHPGDGGSGETLTLSQYVPPEVANARCQRCLSDCDEDKLLLCDGCDLGWHTYCVRPRLHAVPEGRWCCERCPQASQSLTFTQSQAQTPWQRLMHQELVDEVNAPRSETVTTRSDNDRPSRTNTSNVIEQRAVNIRTRHRSRTLNEADTERERNHSQRRRRVETTYPRPTLPRTREELLSKVEAEILSSDSNDTCAESDSDSSVIDDDSFVVPDDAPILYDTDAEPEDMQSQPTATRKRKVVKKQRSKPKRKTKSPPPPAPALVESKRAHSAADASLSQGQASISIGNSGWQIKPRKRSNVRSMFEALLVTPPAPQPASSTAAVLPALNQSSNVVHLVSPDRRPFQLRRRLRRPDHASVKIESNSALHCNRPVEGFPHHQHHHLQCSDAMHEMKDLASIVLPNHRQAVESDVDEDTIPRFSLTPIHPAPQYAAAVASAASTSVVNSALSPVRRSNAVVPSKLTLRVR